MSEDTNMFCKASAYQPSYRLNVTVKYNYVIGVWTRCSAIAERLRCSVRYSFRQK